MRDGYHTDFLGANHVIELPEPGLALQSDILHPPGLAEGKIVVPYIHYSILMSQSTRQALYSAANVDLNLMIKVPKGKGRKWFYDNRVGKENQISNYSYSGTQWDRNQLTRRTAVNWGESEAFVTKASKDSYAYTNAVLQHEDFNENEWRAVEELISKFEIASRLIILTGPIFTITDRFFIRNYGDFPVRIPAAFWKIITYLDSKTNKLSTQAYIFFQDVPYVRSSKGRSRLKLKNLQVTTTEVSQWTGLEFDQKMFESNPLKFYSGPESISTKAHMALFNKDPLAVSLDEGIVGEESIAAARSKFPLEEFYDLINEIRWI